MGVDITKRLYIATIADDCREMADRWGVGVELNQFCTASNMDAPDFPRWDFDARLHMAAGRRMVFHAPFNELFPSAIDPRAALLAYERLRQAAELALSYGIGRMVVHSGFLPMVYYKEWFQARSVEFWRRLLDSLPEGFHILMENVLDDDPALLADVARALNEPRFGLCLDVGHLNVVSQYSALEWVEALSPWLRHVHLHNNDGSHDWHRALPDGSIDMAAVIERVAELAPEASFTIENLHCEPSLLWLESGGFLKTATKSSL